MGMRRSRLVGFVFSIVLLAVLATALPASASPKRVLYTDDGHAIDIPRLAQFGGHTVVDIFDGESNEEWLAALARTDIDAIIAGEDATGNVESLDTATRTAIANFVSNGRIIVPTGGHGTEFEFLNEIFGFNTTHLDSDSGESLVATIQPGAVGTPFEGGPPTLTTPSATEILGSTPGKTIYAGPTSTPGETGTWVFHAPFGAGYVNYLAWDLCGQPEDCGNTGTVENDWYRVLDRALQFPGTCRGQNATITGTNRDDALVGTEGRDVFAAFEGNDTISGLGGNDLICGDAGNDVANGGTGKDKLSGLDGDDLLKGQGGKDVIRGHAGKDKLRGNAGKDKLRGGSGRDVCNGGKKNDSARKCEVEKSI